MDLRTVLAGGFGFCMLMLTCAAWPIYIAGVQILTAELKTGRSPGFLTVLNEATKFWPRVAMLCILVYIAFGLLMMLAFAIAVMIVLGAASVLVIFIALVLLVFQVWMFGRFFINVLFWQQFAVLGQEEVVGALRQSKALARGRTELVWYKRPLWRGAFVVSLWGAFVLALNLPLLWPALRAYFHALSTSQDPQVIMQAVMASSKAEGANLAGIAIGLAQAVLRPLLGIAFVLLYLDATVAAREEDRRD
jgi:hypothetical protein